MKKKIAAISLVLASLSLAGLASCSNSKLEDALKLIEEQKQTIEKLNSENESLKDRLEVAERPGGANGAYSYVASSYEERTKILAALEKYAVDHFLTGIPFIDDGGYALYRPEVRFGSQNYITGYGWGTFGEGGIDADLPGESNEAWKRYYHTFETSDPATVNYGNDKGSVVGDLVAYVGGSMWSTRMNETKDGYEYYPMLAKEFPVAVDASEKTGLASHWKWKIKTGSEAKYSSLSKVSSIAAYNGTNIEAEDYLTPFKMLWTQANGWARAADNHGSSAEIVGEQDYFNKSGSGFNEVEFNKTGVKVEKEGDDWYFHVTYKQPCNAFYARYYINSNIYSPVPMKFVKDTLGGGSFEEGCKLFGTTNIDKKYTPVDTYLSTGPLTIEQWDTDEQIVFKQSENYKEEGRYQIAGYHFDILKAQTTDTEAALKEFLAGNLHSCSIPSTQLKTYQNLNNTDPANGPVGIARVVPGESNYKLNLNACNQTTWNQLFGVEGSITQTAEADYWQCEPAMSNHNFCLGLSYALNRKEFAATLGRGPSINYFGDGYLSDPEAGIAYNTTQEHKDAIAELIAVGDGYGYDLETAKKYFDAALQEMIASGLYKSGDTISLEIAWQTQSQFTNYGDPIIGYFQAAFKDVGAKYGITLEVNNWAGAVWSDVYYKKMMVGQYDIGFGSISGNTLNPLNFLEVLKSDNSSGFTLNWGCDTSVMDLEYDGAMWSFDNLWKAADQGGYFVDGQEVSVFDDADTVSESITFEKQADGSAILKAYVNQMRNSDLQVTVSKAVINGYLGAGTYTEFECEFSLGNDGYLVVIIPKNVVKEFTTNNAEEDLTTYLDVTFKNYILDVPAETTQYYEFNF